MAYEIDPPTSGDAPVRVNLTKTAIEGFEPTDRVVDYRDHGGRDSVSGLLVRVEPTGRKSFFLDYRINGKRRMTRLAGCGDITLYQARQMARAVKAQAAEAALGRADDPELVKRRPKALTLRLFIEEHYMPWAKVNHRDWKNSIDRVERRFSALLDRPLNEIDPLSIERIRSAYAGTKGKPSAGNRDLACLKAILQKAVDWKMSVSNPADAVKLNRSDKGRKRRSITQDEEAALRNAIAGRDREMRDRRARYNEWREARNLSPLPDYGRFVDYLEPFFIVALSSGMRHGELLSMKWEHIALGEGNESITVPGDISKSGQTRVIPIAGEVVQVIRDWKEQVGHQSEYVFANPDTNEPMRSIITVWRRLRAEAGVDPSIGIHTLRHTYATRLLQSGADLRTVSMLCGHADIATTARYLHTDATTMRAAVIQAHSKG